MAKNLIGVSAPVVTLPSAALSPVVQVGRRGRLPQCVVSSARLSSLRNERACVSAELAAKVEELERLALRFEWHAERCRVDARELLRNAAVLKGGVL